MNGIIKKIIAVVLSLLVIAAIIILVATNVENKPPEQKAYDEIASLTDICRDYELSDKLYVIDAGVLDKESRHMAICLQGIIAKKQPAIFIKTNDADGEYLAAIESSGTELIYTDDNGENWTLPTLLQKFSTYIGDNGYVLYRESDSAEGLNMATNLAALYGWLAVPEKCEQIAVDAGLEIKEDFSESEYDISFQRKFFREHKEEFNYNALVHIRYDASGMRDLAIQQGFFTFYIDDDKIGGPSFRKQVMEYAGDNVPVLGWVKYEVAFVKQGSATGNMILPTDHSHNNSYLASFNCGIPSQAHNEAKEYTDTTKHYCAIVYSDGDNHQWIQNGYAEYYEKLNMKTQFPVTWTFPPLLEEFSAVTVRRIYEDATANDYFIAGVSGAGYMHPSEYPEKALAGFTDLTAAAMMKSDLNYISVLDVTPDSALDDKNIQNALSFYARYDNIHGGMLYFDPVRYMGGCGKVYFVNDKPFVSARFSLWHPDGENASVTESWLKEQAEIVNNYPSDIYSINGYSIVNIHPWSISGENLEFFVNQLDEDVVLVTVDELLTMISNNIPHKTATPD